MLKPAALVGGNWNGVRPRKLDGPECASAGSQGSNGAGATRRNVPRSVGLPILQGSRRPMLLARQVQGGRVGEWKSTVRASKLSKGLSRGFRAASGPRRPCPAVRLMVESKSGRQQLLVLKQSLPSLVCAKVCSCVWVHTLRQSNAGKDRGSSQSKLPSSLTRASSTSSAASGP